MCVDVTDNELGILELIHLFVEILDHYFNNVCELDLVFNFHKVRGPPFSTLADLLPRAFPPCLHLLLLLCRWHRLHSRHLHSRSGSTQASTQHPNPALP